MNKKRKITIFLSVMFFLSNSGVQGISYSTTISGGIGAFLGSLSGFAWWRSAHDKWRLDPKNNKDKKAPQWYFYVFPGAVVGAASGLYMRHKYTNFFTAWEEYKEWERGQEEKREREEEKCWREFKESMRKEWEEQEGFSERIRKERENLERKREEERQKQKREKKEREESERFWQKEQEDWSGFFNDFSKHQGRSGRSSHSTSVNCNNNPLEKKAREVLGVSESAGAYAILGASCWDDKETIKKKYHALSRKYHPSMNRAKLDPQLSTVVMQLINDAYDKFK